MNATTKKTLAEITKLREDLANLQKNVKGDLKAQFDDALTIYKEIPAEDRPALYDDSFKEVLTALGLQAIPAGGKATRKGKRAKAVVPPELAEKVLKALPSKGSEKDYMMTKDIAKAAGKNEAGFGSVLDSMKDDGKIDSVKKGTSKLWFKL